MTDTNDRISNLIASGIDPLTAVQAVDASAAIARAKDSTRSTNGMTYVEVDAKFGGNYSLAFQQGVYDGTKVDQQVVIPTTEQIADTSEDADEYLQGWVQGRVEVAASESDDPDATHEAFARFFTDSHCDAADMARYFLADISTDDEVTTHVIPAAGDPFAGMTSKTAILAAFLAGSISPEKYFAMKEAN